MDWGYVAGYFDGEGTAWHRRAKGRANCQVTWCNTHLQSLEAIQAFIGCGTIRSRKQGKHKQIHALVVSDKTSLEPLVDQLLVHCIIKRDALLKLRLRLQTVRATPQYGNLMRAGPVEIARLYHEERWTQKRIGAHFGVGQAAVKNFMRRHAIAARTGVEAMRLADWDSPAMKARNRKIAELRKAEWADPVIRAERIAAIRASQTKRIASMRANRAA